MQAIKFVKLKPFLVCIVLLLVLFLIILKSHKYINFHTFHSVFILKRLSYNLPLFGIHTSLSCFCHFLTWWLVLPIFRSVAYAYIYRPNSAFIALPSNYVSLVFIFVDHLFMLPLWLHRICLLWDYKEHNRWKHRHTTQEQTTWDTSQFPLSVCSNNKGA